MRFFRRRKIVVAIPAAWVRFKEAVDNHQHQAAGYLQDKCLRLSRVQLYVCFALFCLFAGSASGYVVIQSFNGSDAPSRVTPISVPQHIIQEQNKQNATGTTKRQGQYVRVLLLRQRMDSLQVVDKRCYDSIVQVRPGLLDSIRMLEDFYKGNTDK